MIKFKLASIFFVMLILVSTGCVGSSGRIGLNAAKTHALQEINNSMPTWKK
jgi:hypothetical protein